MSALKLLEDLHYKKSRENHPNVPEFAVPRKKFSDRTTNGLTQCILSWLRLHDHYAVRISSTGRYIGGKSYVDVIGRTHNLPGKYIPGTTRRGVSDIHAVIGGVHCSLEIKAAATKDRMSIHQHRTKADVEKSGGIYYAVPTFEAFIKFYNQLIQN